jgi:deoxyribose-phosphate aldolase
VAYVEEEVRAVRQAVPRAVLKVILETGHFTPEEVRNLAEAAIRGGADFLKTSTGFGPRGASPEDVALLLEVARGRAQVKAAGGIRDRKTALQVPGDGGHPPGHLQRGGPGAGGGGAWVLKGARVRRSPGFPAT